MKRTGQFLANAWRNMRGSVIFGAITMLILSIGIVIGDQARGARDAQERGEIRAACDARVLAVRDVFTRKSAERDGVVAEVGNLVSQSISIQRETLALMQRRAPVTDGIARHVQQIDAKTAVAASEARAAKAAANRAARAVEADTPESMPENNR